MAGSIKTRHGYEVFINTAGEIVIEQNRLPGADEREVEPDIIVLHPDDARALVTLLRTEIRNVKEGGF